MTDATMPEVSVVLMAELRKRAQGDDKEAYICGRAAEEIDRLRGVISEGTKWTKVTEELPDGDETVIVHGHTGYRGFGWHDGEYWRDCVSGDRFANLKLNIEHWMPLPEAPK